MRFANQATVTARAQVIRQNRAAVVVTTGSDATSLGYLCAPSGKPEPKGREHKSSWLRSSDPMSDLAISLDSSWDRLPGKLSQWC